MVLIYLYFSCCLGMVKVHTYDTNVNTYLHFLTGFFLPKEKKKNEKYIHIVIFLRVSLGNY